MKLIRLKINDPAGFRSLQCGFEHHFRTDWSLEDELAQADHFAPFVCAGRNGSGKSNLLEALAAIFFFWRQRDGGFTFLQDALYAFHHVEEKPKFLRRNFCFHLRRFALLS